MLRFVCIERLVLGFDQIDPELGHAVSADLPAQLEEPVAPVDQIAQAISTPIAIESIT